MKPLLIVLLTFLMWIIGVLVSALIMMFLWNLIAQYFSLPIINYWIALLIVAILAFIGSFFRGSK